MSFIRACSVFELFLNVSTSRNIFFRFDIAPHFRMFASSNKKGVTKIL